MSRVSKSQQDSLTAEFVSITGSNTKDAASTLKKHGWRLDAAIDAYYSNPPAQSGGGSASDRAGMEKRILALYDQYKDPDSGQIGIDGTLEFCKALSVDPEEVAVLTLAYELKSPGIGDFPKDSWKEGWLRLGADTIPKMKATLAQLNGKLSNDTEYLQSVYNFTFDFAKSETGQRSIAIETAVAFWGLLLPAGLKGSALKHMDMHTDQSTGDVTYTPSNEPGWKPEFNDLWFEYLNENGGKGVSKDTWQMFFDFVRTIDDKFQKHDLEAAWPSAIDGFVDWAKERVN